MTDTSHPDRVYIWDAFVRLTHISYPLFLFALWWTAENGKFDLHVPIAITFSGIITFRLAWGFLGTDTARFATFIRSPRATLSYAKSLFSKTPDKQKIGHNPLGGLSVIALLGLMTAQIATGLFVVDTDGLYSGALSQFISFDMGQTFGEYHELTFNILLAMVTLHLIAIAAYAFLKRKNLIRPMVTGHMQVTESENITGANTRPQKLRVGLSLLIALLVAGGLGWLQFM